MKKGLYWLTTPCNLENWFGVASTKRKAEIFHEEAEGFGENYATAEFICWINEEFLAEFDEELESEYWPTHELLEKIGCAIVKTESPRVVNYKGKVYTEGRSVEAMLIELANKKEGVYVLNIQGTLEYKIGITKDLHRRIKQFETGNPSNIKLVYFVETKHYKSFEKHLHKVFKSNRIKGEWFQFDEQKLNELYDCLCYASQFDQFVLYNAKGLSELARCY